MATKRLSDQCDHASRVLGRQSKHARLVEQVRKCIARQRFDLIDQDSFQAGVIRILSITGYERNRVRVYLGYDVGVDVEELAHPLQRQVIVHGAVDELKITAKARHVIWVETAVFRIFAN